ncbi:hypothetical protein APHAL10511_002483 [Amanita phalloides]|nr:hypothetical protein APHAL10511_002483 [Amanita phalloides]
MHVCTHCNNRSFVNDDALRQHLKSSSAHPFCTHCNRHFINEKAYEAHMAARHPPTFDCAKCTRTFRSQSSLEDHYRGSPEHPNCSRCGKGFRNKRLMEEHYSMQHALVSCPCGPAMLFFDELDEHYLTSDMHPSCVICHCGFKDNESHKEHMAFNHGNLYCAPCSAYFETPETLSDHYFSSPGHPSCITCSKGFRGDQEFSLHLAAEHASSPAINTSPGAKIGVIGPIQRSSIPIRRPVVRVDSPALSVRPGFGSPLLDVMAPSFSPTVFPPPGGVVDELWAMRENMEVPAPRVPTATNVFASLVNGPLRRKMEKISVSGLRESSSLSSMTAERSPLYVTAEQDPYEVYSQFNAFDHPSVETSHYPFMQESDPIVPLERGVINNDNTKIVGSGVRDKQNGLNMGFQPFSSPASRASTSIQSFSPQSGSAFHNLASPTSSASSSVSSNDIPFVVSSPVLSSFFQASERLSAGGARDLLLSAMATHMELLPEPELHNMVDAGLPVSGCMGSSPTDSSNPDVSSLLGLAALSNIATMPVEQSQSEQSGDSDVLNFPKAHCPHPESPCGATCDVDGDSGSSDTLAPSVTRSLSDDNSTMVTVDANVTAAVSSMTRLECTTPVNANLILPDGKDTIPCLASSNSVTSIQSPSVTNSTSDNCIPVLQHQAEKLTLSLDNPAEHRPTPSDPATQNPELRPLRCRLCQLDRCDEPTATMCGHLFCYQCITKSVMNSPGCPVCATPTLLYCLFRLDLWS